MKVISSFAASAAPVYGNRFLEGCEKWDIPLTLVCYEDFSDITNHGEFRVDGWLDNDLKSFIWYCQIYREMSNDERCHRRNDYRFQVERFAWKAFAMTSMLKADNDWIVWLDSDVVLFGYPDWPTLLNKDCDVVHLGRSGWHHSESGFIAFNMRRRGGQVLALIRRIYRTFDIFDEQEWHDAWIFDQACKKLGVSMHNISPEAPGLDAWEYSPLSKWSRHLKGNQKYEN